MGQACGGFQQARSPGSLKFVAAAMVLKRIAVAAHLTARETGLY